MPIYPKVVPTVFNVFTYGATGGGTVDDTAAIQSAFAAANGSGGTLLFPAGTYLTTGLVFTGAQNVTIRGDRGAILWIAAPTLAAPNQVSKNIVTITDSSDFAIEGLTVDGRRDTIAPLTPIAVNASSGQATVQVANGASAPYVVGQKLSVLGGLTANSGNDVNKQDQSLTVLSITPGVGGANDVITFTTNLGNTYTAAAGTVSDGYGPYAANGGYITPWQTGAFTVAGRALAQEDQQNGIHLIACKRFRISGCGVRNVWESPIRCGTHLLDGTSQNDGCSGGTISDNVLSHGYDQGIGLWVSKNITVSGNVADATGWCGVCMTGSSDCTVTGNVMINQVQRIPGDSSDGNGVAVEGGIRNTISGNRIGGNYGPGIRLTALGTIPFASLAQVATTVASGSNATALPQATVNVASTTGFASAGQFTVLSSAGAQQVTYTGKTGTSFTGCTGGIGTMFTGQRVTQYPLFLNNGAKLAIGSTSATVSDGTKFQVGGSYSIVDGPRTEQITVSAIASNVLTITKTAYWHPDQCQISQAIPEATVITGNSISGPGSLGGGDAGIVLAGAVRTSITGNTIDRAGLRGIDGVSWSGGGLQPPYGTVVQGNTITTPDTLADGASYQAIAFQQCSDLTITGNHCTGAPATTGYFVALYLQACVESIVSGNLITDAYALGIQLDVTNDWVCKAVVVSGNSVLRCLGEGIKLFGGDSLQVSNNTVAYSAANGGGAGFGGGLNIRGVQWSAFANNVIYNNGRGIGLDTASINSVNVFTANNTFSGNVVRDDGNNYDVYSGSSTQQNFGIKELSSGQGPNTYLANTLTGNQTNLSLTSTANIFAAVTVKNTASPAQVVGRLSTSGAPSTGTWATGDIVMDSANAWHYCTAGGSPGTWT